MRGAIALFISCMLSTSAFADAVIFSPMEDTAAEASLVRSFVGADVAVETAVLDLDDNGTNEVLVRSADCEDGQPCRTLVYRMMVEDWAAVFDRSVTSLETGSPGLGAMKDLEADGLVWKWRSQGYRVDVASSGEQVAFSLAPADYAQPLANQFGAGAGILFGQQKATTVEVAAVDLEGAGASEVLVRLQGPGVCGRVYGCPIRLLKVVDGQYVTLLEGFASGGVALSSVMRDGRKDIISQLPGGGFAVYGWTGDVYGESEIVKGVK